MPKPTDMDELGDRLEPYFQKLTEYLDQLADDIWFTQKAVCEIERKLEVDLGEWSACARLGDRDPPPPPPPPDFGRGG